MSDANVIFIYDGTNYKILCNTKDKLRDICQKFAIKAEIQMNFLIFLYGGNQMNLDLRFKDLANSIDLSNKEMKVLVYRNGNEEYVCPNCQEKVKLHPEKIDELVSAYNNIKDSINGIKWQIENIIKNCTIKEINIQLDNINILLQTINDKFKKIMINSKIYFKRVII